MAKKNLGFWSNTLLSNHYFCLVKITFSPLSDFQKLVRSNGENLAIFSRALFDDLAAPKMLFEGLMSERHIQMEESRTV